MNEKAKAWFQGFAPVTKIGGPGSGHHGHGGRPGQRGGSAPSFSGPVMIPAEMAGQHERHGSFGNEKYSGLARQAFWKAGDTYVFSKFVNEPSGSDRKPYHVVEGKKAKGKAHVLDARDIDAGETSYDRQAQRWVQPGISRFKNVKDAQKFLKSRYGVDWSGNYAREEPRVLSGTPAQRMSARQVQQAVAQGRLTPEQARARLRKG